MSITAAQVKELRDRTGVAMMACKKALEETNGDIEKAIEELRKRGAAKAAEKSDRSTQEGAIAMSGRSLVKISCETDFVAKNESFLAFIQEIADKAESEGVEEAKAFFESVKTDKMQEIGENLVLELIEKIEEGSIVNGYVHFNAKVGSIVALDGGTEEQAKNIAMHAVAMAPIVANPEDVPEELLEKERRIAKEQLEQEGKPANIIDNIIAGKIKKFCAERALTSQSFVMDGDKTVQEYLGDVKVVKFLRFSI